MKVLAISASPRKGGNSDVLCDQFLKGAAEAGNEIKKIALGQVNISPCAACYGCSKSHRCVKKDDMSQILQELIDADVIVLATPVYFYSMDAQMKIMIDRCLPGIRRSGIRTSTISLRRPTPSIPQRRKPLPGFGGSSGACLAQKKKGSSMEPALGIRETCTGIRLLRKHMKWAKR